MFSAAVGVVFFLIAGFGVGFSKMQFKKKRLRVGVGFSLKLSKSGFQNF